ncbi:pimeloyl-ACP methyl ester carboxylesterase [Streptomyces sp. TLI_235]|nr:alpha/beta fold hydrolase [Streptomyces sp. TLI_235]PBC76696.1 pimeloyl-ACP methyl ester carboxylesterase [Streptomyces sp. TLI_235]
MSATVSRPLREFDAAYEALLARWPAGTAELDVPTPYGTTRVHACGPADAPPLLLLPGGGATGAVWYGAAAALGGQHRVLAVDLPGDPGRSAAARPLRTADDLTAWLDALLDGLGAERADLCGHSYGGLLALAYAVRRPRRIGRLALLDPTQCFAGFRAGYLLHALPMLLRPTRGRALAFLARETGGTADPGCAEVFALGACLPDRARPVRLRRPDAAAVRCPVLVLTAGRSGAHDPRKVAGAARRALPQVEVAVLEGATHHGLPAVGAPDLNARLAAFLGRGQAAFGASL